MNSLCLKQIVCRLARIARDLEQITRKIEWLQARVGDLELENARLRRDREFRLPVNNWDEDE